MADLFGTYDNRIKLTISNTNIDAELTWFPVTVFLTSTAGEEVFVEFDADEDFDRVAFTTSDESTQLYADCELFDDSAQKAIYHVSKTGWAISNSGTTDFYMYYDNDAGHNATYIDKTYGKGTHYPTAHTSDYVKATTVNGTYWAHQTTDPARSLTGARLGSEWMSADSSVTNQRFHIDLGSAKIINKIYYENSHNSGGDTDVGVQNFTFQGSNTGAGTFDDLVYANDEGWTTLATSQSTFDEHVAADQADPKYITVTNATAYRYYAFKFADNYGDASTMALREVALQKTAAAAENVYDANFKAVYHMNDDTTATILDSTSNANHGTKKAANEPVEATGKVGQGQDFDGADDYISVPDSADLELLVASTESTVECIINQNIEDASVYAMSKNNEWGLFPYDKGATVNKWAPRFNTFGGNTLADISDDCDINEWYYLAYAIDAGTTIKTYLDGSLHATSSVADDSAATDADFIIGSKDGTNDPFDGQIDEIRISKGVQRTAAWLKATYYSLWDGLLTYGAEETSGVTYNSIMFGMNF